MRATRFRSRSLWKIILIVVVFLAATLPAHSERLPIRTYSTADGLPHNVINKIVRDSRGFLWFCTDEGLARFDGYSFTSYGTEEGLPHTRVNDILETRAGQYWVATNGGLVHFTPKARAVGHVVSANEGAVDSPPMFTTVWPDDKDIYARAVTTLLEASDGSLWCGTLKGLQRLEMDGRRLALRPVDVGMPNEYGEWRFITDLVEDRFGSIWVATHGGLYRRWPDGNAAHYDMRSGLPDYVLHDLLLDHEGQLWIGSRNAGFFRIAFDETHRPPAVTFTLKPSDFTQSEWINCLLETSDHKLWAATARGLLQFIPGGDSDGKLYRIYHHDNGLSDENVSALAEDTGGNLWLGSGNGAGVMKLTRNGFITYGEQDGIKRVDAVFPDNAGGVCFRGYVLGDKQTSIFDGGRVDVLNSSEATLWLRFGRFDGQRLNWFMPDALRGADLGFVSEGVTLQTRQSHEWWIATGPYHFPATDNFAQLKSARPLADVGKDRVLGNRQVWRLFEDSRERIWISLVNSGGNGLALWERKDQSVHDLTGAANLPSFHDDQARSFGEDRAGNVWIGFGTGLARFSDGTFTFFGAPDGLPPGAVVQIFTDHLGRLWLASSRSGLISAENPAALHPTFTIYKTAQGLSSNVVSVITEDGYGRIYFGTGQGLDCLEPATGRVRHYTTADGLAGGNILAAFAAADGWLWFGTSEGLSRFLPEPDRSLPAPPVLLTGVRVAGIPQNVSALGETDLHLADLPASSNQLQIDFVGLGFASGELLRYQYMLEGADRGWSAPTQQRSVTYARLASGRYTFLVRALNADGQVSAAAVINFRVLAPLWLRWWFIVITALAIGIAVYLLYRFRISRLLEVANMRTRIATDLHDDIGANLTRISILSEVAKQQFGNGDEKSGNPLSSIAEIARESVTSMSDIVWAINPERDSLRDLTRKMRQHADEVFTLRDIDLEFHAPGLEQDLKLGVNVRRDLLLIFKEAVSNAARHSNCSRVLIDLTTDSRHLSLRVSDDGVGFEPTGESSGHGLLNMQRRAQKLGGSFQINSATGKGTTLKVEIPLVRSRRTV